MINTYITIPIEVEAMQYNRDNLNDLIKFTKCSNVNVTIRNGKFNCTATLNEIKFLIIEDDYVVKNADGSINILSQDNFEKLYLKKE